MEEASDSKGIMENAENKISPSAALSVSEKSDSNAEEIPSQNLRTSRNNGGFGCWASIVSIFAICAAFAAFALNSCQNFSKDELSDFKSTIKSAAKCIHDDFKKLIKYLLLMKPNEKSVFDVRFLDADKSDKYIVAQLREKFSTHKRAVKWKAFSADLDYESEPIYKYYIPLTGIKMSVMSQKDGKISIGLSFPPLELDTPVGEENRNIKVSQSKFSSDANKSLDSFISSEIPKQIEKNGRDYYRILAAQKEAKVALDKWVRNTFLPLINIPSDIVGNIEIYFGADNANEDVKNEVITLSKSAFEKVGKDKDE